MSRDAIYAECRRFCREPPLFRSRQRLILSRARFAPRACLSGLSAKTLFAESLCFAEGSSVELLANITFAESPTKGSRQSGRLTATFDFPVVADPLVVLLLRRRRSFLLLRASCWSCCPWVLWRWTTYRKTAARFVFLGALALLLVRVIPSLGSLLS